MFRRNGQCMPRRICDLGYFLLKEIADENAKVLHKTTKNTNAMIDIIHSLKLLFILEMSSVCNCIYP